MLEQSSPVKKWFVAAQKHSDIQTSVFNKGKYISFVNEEIRGSGAYISPANLKESMHIIGKWAENDGYPSSAAVQIP